MFTKSYRDRFYYSLTRTSERFDFLFSQWLWGNVSFKKAFSSVAWRAGARETREFTTETRSTEVTSESSFVGPSIVNLLLARHMSRNASAAWPSKATISTQASLFSVVVKILKTFYISFLSFPSQAATSAWTYSIPCWRNGQSEEAQRILSARDSSKKRD